MQNKNKISVLERDDFNVLLEKLSRKGYELYGPIISNDNLVYDTIRTDKDLPIGWNDRQTPGSYRLKKGRDETLFGFTVGAQSWKKLLYPAQQKLWDISADGKRFSINVPEPDDSKRALIGVRSCELHAIAIHDKIFTAGPYTDPFYQARRNSTFIVAVNCTEPSGTCFCTSMNTGPKADTGFDLSLTEIIESEQHYFLIEAGSEAGMAVLKSLPVREAKSSETEAGEKAMQNAVKKMGRKLNTKNVRKLLYDNFDDPHWDKIAERCLSCGNCTMVCPTCFCTIVEDNTALDGRQAERLIRWDSCYTQDFSYIHGGSIRASVKARYRQWMMHKLVYWYDQFDTSGCVGCGRCITWCPAGIDITEEAAIFNKKE
jgi:sulfhydrogenase subunit beta (sulfur reductase)